MDGKCQVIMANGEKVYKCTQCNKRFSRPYRIQRHLQVHNPSRQKVQCHVCGKYFTRVDTLQTHIRCVHTNERPYACTFDGCDKRFPVQSGLVHHLKVSESSNHSIIIEILVVLYTDRLTTAYVLRIFSSVTVISIYTRSMLFNILQYYIYFESLEKLYQMMRIMS